MVSLQHPLPLRSPRTAHTAPGRPQRWPEPFLPGEREVCRSCAPRLQPAPSAEPPRQPSPPGVALRDAASPARNGAPLGRRQGWRFRSFLDLRAKTKTRPATTGAVPLFSGFRRPRFLRVGPAIATLARGGPGSRTPHATTPPPQRSPVPPVRHHAELRARWLQPQSFHNSRASLAPGSGRHSLSGPSTPVPSSAAKAAAPCHPRPARPLSQPGFPASCAATAARDPPPSRLPLSCLFRSTNNFCSDAGSLGPRRPLFPASPPSGYENSKQLADLRADQLRLPPTPAFRSNPAAAASKISLRAGLGGGGDFSGRGCLRSKEPLRAHSSLLK